MLKAVVDTNVFVSSFLGGKITGEIYQQLIKEKFSLIISDDMLGELINVLSRPKFGLEKSDIEKVITFLRLNALFVKPVEKIPFERDPKDSIILECAVAGKSKFIITRDKDLLELKKFRNIAILTPAKFLKLPKQ